MGKSQHCRKGATNLDLVATRLQKFIHNFRAALASDLKAFSTDQHCCTVLQYVDDLLNSGGLY
jgi:hypothetical protein